MNAKSDVIIIGGGAIGLCTAHYLSDHGMDITVLEKDEVGAACSSKNAGLVVPSHLIPLAAPGIIAQGLKWLLSPSSPFYIKPRLNLDLIDWLWQFKKACTHERMKQSIPALYGLLRKSANLFSELAHLEDLSFGYHRNGLLMLYQNDETFREELQDAQMARDIGQEVSILTATEVREVESNTEIKTVGGIRYHGDAHIDPTLFVNAMFARLKKKAIRFHTGTEVLGLRTEGSKIVGIRTSKGEFSADEIVLAGGSWSPQIVRDLGLKLRVQAGKGYSVTVPCPVHRPNMPMLLVEARIAVTPLDGRIRFAGTLELSGIDTSISRRRVDALVSAIPHYLPAFHSLDLTHADIWSGLRPCTPDGLPFIGRFKKYSNLIAANGHAMLGITLAPATGQIVSEIIREQRPTLDLTPFRIERFD